MSDPAALAQVRRWTALHPERMREIRRAEARTRDKVIQREHDRKYRAAHHEARNLAARCKVFIKVARRWIAEGCVPPYKYPGCGLPLIGFRRKPKNPRVPLPPSRLDTNPRRSMA